MSNTIIATESIDILRVFFFRYPWYTWMARASRDYQRCFGIRNPEVSHLALQFGSRIYEVSLAGTECYDYDDSFLANPDIFGFYECNIKDTPEDIKLAARFTLDYDVLTDRKLKPKECLRYLRHWLSRHKRMEAFSYDEDFSIPVATMQRRKFNMPYTCASQVAHVMHRIFGLEPVADSHLPTAILWMTLAMQESNLGAFYQAYDG